MGFPIRLAAWLAWSWFCLKAEPALFHWAMPKGVIDQVFLGTMVAYAVTLMGMGVALSAFTMLTVPLRRSEAAEPVVEPGFWALLRGLAFLLLKSLGLLALVAAGGVLAGWWAYHANDSLVGALLIGVLTAAGGVVALASSNDQLDAAMN